MSTITILWVVAGGLILWVILTYNRLVTLRMRIGQALSDIDVQAKRRYDLIPNLVETVKGYAKHEQGTLEKVIAARNAAMTQGGNALARDAAENQLSGALKSIFALAESYPDLKANTNFLELQRELVDTEDKMQAARRFYNSTAGDLNVAVQTFPTNIIAGMFGFHEAKFFEIANASERDAVKVAF